MRNKILKIGFIGGGLNSAVGLTHKIASQMDNRFALDSGCFSRSREVNEQTAESWGIRENKLYFLWEEMLAKEKSNLDAVVVLTPTPSHKDVVLAAINHGYNVICDKTLAVSSQQILDITDSVNKNKAFLAVTYNYTGYPMIRELRHMIVTGKLGQIFQVQIEMPQEGFVRVDKNGKPCIPQEWRQKDIDIPVISLDLGSHLHNMVHFLTEANVARVVAKTSNFGEYIQVKDNVMCLAEYSNEMVCNIWYSKSALGNRNGLKVRVYGEKGSAEWYQANPEAMTFCDNKGHIQVCDRSNFENVITGEARYHRFKAGHPSGFIEAFANHYADIADSLLKHKAGDKSDSPYVFGASHALEGMKMLEAINKSSLSNKWERV